MNEYVWIERKTEKLPKCEDFECIFWTHKKIRKHQAFDTSIIWNWNDLFHRSRGLPSAVICAGQYRIQKKW